jgi:Mn2+/Fe2+ NRAMP family transporter
MDANTIKLSQLETYIGAFLTDFFSFFMITATASTLFVNGIILQSGEQAALAIQPFAGQLAGTLFAFGLLAAGFMGMIIVPLSTAYAFSEFFGLSGSLDTEFSQGKTFYILFMAQLLISAFLIIIPGISLFQMAIATQSINALVLPFVFYFLIRLTNNRKLMGIHANNGFQKYFSTIFSILILIASFVAVLALIFRW